MSGANASPHRTKLLFFDRGNASYIRTDLEALRTFADVKRFSFVARTWYALPLAFLRQLWGGLLAMHGCQTVVVHFAGWNALVPLFLARIFRKPSFLFLHGTDAASIPELDYGQFRKWPLSWATSMSMRLAKRVVVADEGLLHTQNTYSGSRVVEQGLRVFVPDLRTPVSVIPHGLDAEKWPLGEGARDIDVLTVAVGLASARVRRIKGVDLLLEVASRMSELRFVVVGLSGDGVVPIPGNVIAYPEVSPEVLRSLYQRAKCYAQLSRTESFGVALVEAMLSGCIPVVSPVGAMPAIIGDTGCVVQGRVHEDIRAGVMSALKMVGPDASAQVRQRAAQRYRFSVRMAELHRLLA